MNNEDEKRSVDLWEKWRIIKKRKWVVFTFTGALFLLIGIFTFTATPIYQARATLLVGEETSKIFSIKDEFGYQRTLPDLRFYNTQLKLLESKSLAERVARKLNLATRTESGTGIRQSRGFLASIKHVASLKWIPFKKKTNEEESDLSKTYNPYSDIADFILKKLEVSPIRDTKLIEVKYKSPSPTLVAEITNTLADEFINFLIEKRYQTTQVASDFLNEQIIGLREDLAAKQRELQKYGQEKELFFLNNTESTAVSQLADLNAAYTQAQIDRIKAEAIYRELENADIDSLPQSVSNLGIRQLNEEYTKIKNEYEEKSKDFKPNYPEMIRLKARLDSMKSELMKTVDGVKSDYRAALKRENSLRRLLNEKKGDVAKLNSDAIMYNAIKIEVDNKRMLLDSLVARQNETLVSARLGNFNVGNVSVIDRAEVPKIPVSPKKGRNIILSLLVGLFGGALLCFLFEYLDNTVKGPEDVERLTGLPSLGVIPYLPSDGTKKNRRYGYYSSQRYTYGKEDPDGEGAKMINEVELVNHLNPKLSISEDYRTVRTSILFSHPETPPKSIAFSSAIPREGKTASVVNLAVSFSQLEEKVLLIDSDLRKPRLHRIFKVRNLGGLSGYLTGNIELNDVIQKTSLPNVWLIPSGPIPPNPTELLNSRRMTNLLEEVKNGFDVVLLDTPPILAGVDGVIIGSIVDSIILVIRPGKVAYNPFLNAVEELRRAKANIMGVIFNGVEMKKGEYYYLDNYMHYRYEYYGEEGKQD